MIEFVFVLTENNDDGNSVIGVYRDLETATKEKYAIIRDYYDISEDEIPDEKLDDEVAGVYAEYDIVKRKLL